MAQVRGSFFPHVRAALERRGVLAQVDEELSTSTRKILGAAEPMAWYDEGHAVAVYEVVARLHDATVVREVGREAARLAMSSAWRDLMSVLEGLIGGTPRMAFEQLPVLWNATRRDAGEVRCVESSPRHAVTELTGFAYADSAAWVEVWIAHHEALLRHFRFGGRTTLETADPGVVRLRTCWVEEPAAAK